MKKNIKTIIIIGILIALGVGYYYYLANKEQTKDATDVVADTGEVAVLTSRNIAANYPESPKEIVDLYARITKAYYYTTLSDEEIEKLGRQARILFDDELLAVHPEEKFLQALKEDISSYNSMNLRITSYAIQSATKTRYTTFEGQQYASICMVYYMREGDEFIESYNRFMLRKDNEGHWKILYWELLDEDEVEDL